MKESLKVLKECAEMQTKKSQDYQSQESTVLQAMHYRRGIDTIHDILIGKLQRATSIIESGNEPNYESLEDTYKDNNLKFEVSHNSVLIPFRRWRNGTNIRNSRRSRI